MHKISSFQFDACYRSQNAWHVYYGVASPLLLKTGWISQPGGISCWAVWRSGLWCSGTIFLMVGAGRDCGKDGWGPSRYYWLYWSIVQGKYPGWRGEGHQWFLHLCSLSAGGSCGLLHYSSRTRQWCSWSAHSQWFPCRRWWGLVEGDLLFSTGGERVGAVVPSWKLAWCWWSRWCPLWCAPPGI